MGDDQKSNEEKARKVIINIKRDGNIIDLSSEKFEAIAFKDEFSPHRVYVEFDESTMRKLKKEKNYFIGNIPRDFRYIVIIQGEMGNLPPKGIWFELKEGSNNINIEFNLISKQIESSVICTNGKPASNVKLYVISVNPDYNSSIKEVACWQRVVTNQEGKFFVSDLIEGTYNIMFESGMIKNYDYETEYYSSEIAKYYLSEDNEIKFIIYKPGILTIQGNATESKPTIVAKCKEIALKPLWNISPVLNIRITQRLIWMDKEKWNLRHFISAAIPDERGKAKVDMIDIEELAVVYKIEGEPYVNPIIKYRHINGLSQNSDIELQLPSRSDFSSLTVKINNFEEFLNLKKEAKGHDIKLGIEIVPEYSNEEFIMAEEIKPFFFPPEGMKYFYKYKPNLDLPWASIVNTEIPGNGILKLDNIVPGTYRVLAFYSLIHPKNESSEEKHEWQNAISEFVRKYNNKIVEIKKSDSVVVEFP